MRFSLIFLLLLFTSVTSAQNLTGTWEGNGTMGTEYVRFVIVKIGQEYIGYTYDRGIGHCKANFRGKFDSSSRRLKGRNDGFIEKSGMHSQGVYNLKYSFENGQHVLRGHVSAKSVGTKILSLGIPIHITLTMVNNDIDTTKYIREALAKINTGSEDETDPGADALPEKIMWAKQNRVADTLQVIHTPARKIRIKIFDNGITDGDSITVLYNNTPVVMNAMVSATPFEFDISLDDKATDHAIILVAHNLGSIPPNTATVLINAGDKEYRIHASSDYKKNAVIVIGRPAEQ